MGFMEKLKNIFFEEEDDEDEEIEDTRPKVEKKEKKEKVAKKIEFPSVKKEAKEEIKEIKKEVVEEIPKEVKPKEEIKKEEPKKVKVNTELIFDDDDFIFDNEPKQEIKPKVDPPKVNKKVEPIEKKVIKPVEKKEKYVAPKETYKYTKKVETKTKTFTPSPIISPIYGILDKNYRKEEVKENKEIRLTSRPSKVDFDSVRNKAFGDLEYDLFEDIKEETTVVEPKDIVLEEEKKEKNKQKIEKIIKKEDDSKPAIDKVTLGEADEYYNDLGLAYNTDYKDLSKDQSDGKVEETKDKDNNLEDNLFDLIESMYDREE